MSIIRYVDGVEFRTANGNKIEVYQSFVYPEHVQVHELAHNEVVIDAQELEALRKDAERYRWLRELPNADELNVRYMGTDLDDVIDAAMQEAGR